MTDSLQPKIPAPDQEQATPAESTLPSDGAAEVYAFPLSPVQGRMWESFLANPKSPIFNASFRWQLEGLLDPLLIEQSFAEITRRHEILRAYFDQVDGEIRQLIAPHLQVKLSQLDLSGLPESQRDAEFDRISVLEAQTCFDLRTGPLFRVGLVRLESRRHVLTLTLHHIICDGWSIGIIMEELQKIYAAFAEGHPSPLPDLPIQYGDYVIWQKEFLERDEIKQQLTFWKNKLQGYDRLEVPGDLGVADDADRRSAIVSILLPKELSEKLKEFSNQQGGTLFITTLAANVALLLAETGKTDIAIGSPLAGRTRADLEGLIGVFINHVLFRVNAAGDPTFTELALRVRDTVWDAFANQDVPFEDVVREVAGKDGLSAESFYLINYICQREYARASTFVFEFAGLKMSTMPSKSQGALYDLNFFMVEREVGWRLSLEYRIAKYSEDFAKRLHGKFFQLLEAIAQNPNQKVSELVGGRRVEGNFSAEAKESTAIASAADGEASELYALPASVAQQRFWLLEKLSHGNAAFHMPACVRLAGPVSSERLEAAFKTIIRRHEILRTTFEDSNGELMQIISPPRPFVLGVTKVSGETLAEQETALPRMVRDESQIPFDLSKGPLFRARLFQLGAEDHVLLITLHHILADGWSQSILQKELWTVYESDDPNSDAGLPPLNIQYSDFAAWQKEWLSSEESNDHREFWLNALKPPLPVLDFPTDRPAQNRPASHGAIETYLLPSNVAAALKSFAQKNSATMFTLMLACFGAMLSRYSDQEDVVVGSPVANRRTETEPLIGPFAGPIALRLDLKGNPTLQELLMRVRDFTLDALSHSDLPFEVLLEKIRPLAVQRRNPLFQFYFFYQTAFLQPRKMKNLTVSPMPTFSVGTPFELQLGFVERQEGIRAQLEYNPDLFDAATIRSILDYYQKILDVLLADPNQRLSDLPLPEKPKTSSAMLAAAVPSRRFIAPRDSVELQLALMWERLIGRQPIGVNDDFFEIGGQSLLAAQMVIEIEREFGRKIDLSTLLTASTIEALAQKLKSGETNDQSSLVPIRATGNRPPLFCVHGGGGHVLRFRAMAARLDPQQPFYGLRSPEADGAVSRLTVEDLAAKYIRDIRALQPKGPYFLAGASFGGLVAYEMATQLAVIGETVALLGLFDTGNPAYYRDLSFGQSLQFQALYVIDRLRLYGKRLTKGETWQLIRDLGRSVGARLSYWFFRFAQKLYGWSKKPLPTGLRDNVKMFSAVGQAYTPKPYSGELILFRAEGRTAEYGSNLTLGWDAVVTGKVRVINVPGDHMTILEEPFVWGLVEQLDACLKQAL